MNDVSIGIDGCPAGWLCVESSRGNYERAIIFKNLSELWDFYHTKKVELILIDIPIGLLEKGSEPRACDKAARKYLTRKRSSSIFPIPCRKAIYTKSYEEANKINRKLIGKGISKQSWNISGKIREMDQIMQQSEKARNLFIESHPEVCFMAFNKGIPMNYYKKSKEGIQERIILFERSSSMNKEIFEDIKNQFKPSQVSEDDILDAMILSLTASRGKILLRFLPVHYKEDLLGLPMRIAYSFI